MSNLKKYYADRIKSVLPSGESNGITKEELMKRMSVTDAKLMDSILKDVESSLSICCKNGKYFIQTEMPKEIRDLINANYTIGAGIEHR